MATAHPHPGQVQRLLWAIGEAHRRRRRDDVSGRAAREAGVAASLGPVTGTGTRGPVIGAAPGAAGPHPSVVGRGARFDLVVTSELNGSTAPDFLDRVLGLVEEGARSIVVDLGAVVVIDAQGVAALASAQTLLASLAGELVLRSPRSRTLTALDAAGLGDRFVIC